MAPPTFSTVLLVGGKSRRMGRDKALLPVGDSGLLLWERQWQLLEKFKPKEMFWSGPPRPKMPFGARIVEDAVEDTGPLAGISACLELMRTDLLIVLAIDLPEINTAILLHLLAKCERGRGAVYQQEKYFEPLATVYPKSLNLLATQHLAQGRYALQDFIREAIQQEMMTALPLPEIARPYFKNVNTPGDL